MTKILSNFIWLDDIDDALNFANQLKSEADYSIDTEFERSRTYYLNPALLQIKCNDQVYLIDIAIPEVAKLVLTSIKGLVLHSGSEDLELYYQVTGLAPERVYDTQVAAALSGYGLHTSYLNLVQDLMGVELDKGMSRSDWLARPLSAEQIQYAIEDIAYLDEFKAVLTSKFTDKGLDALFAVLMQQMKSQLNQDGHAEKLFQKMVKSERMNHADAKKLWLILNWRDELAQVRNKPRNWILNPKQISDVVKKVKSHADLFNLGLHPNFVKYNGEKLLKRLYDNGHSDLSSMPVPIKLNSQQGNHLSEMKQRLKQVAERFDLEPSIIINTQALKKLAASGGDLDQLETWNALP
ncbi:MAG: ribonuclease D [Marinicella sp.]